MLVSVTTYWERRYCIFVSVVLDQNMVVASALHLIETHFIVTAAKKLVNLVFLLLSRLLVTHLLILYYIELA